MHQIRSGLMNHSMYVYACLLCFITTAMCWLPSSSPDYCSHKMIDRSIQPLARDELLKVSELLQVQVVIRHGSRSPISTHACWHGYNTDWHNCRETLSLDALPVEDLRVLPHLIDVKFDTKGNCDPGNLLPEGYMQEQVNGELLREAYMDGSSQRALFDNVPVPWSRINQSQLYLFSDNMERTLLSGQVVVSNAFDVPVNAILPWTVGDYFVDAGSCPVLRTMLNEAAQSNAFLNMNSSAQADGLEVRLSSLWGEGEWSWNLALDCLMTSICSYRDVPDGGQAGVSSMDQGLLDDIMTRDELQSSFFLHYNDSIIAKTSSNKLANQMRSLIEHAISGKEEDDDAAIERKFALFSAHDSNLMALLVVLSASRWDGKRPPYASMLVLELYAAAHSQTNRLDLPKERSIQNDDVLFYFRLIYNGKPLLLPDCESSLCDVRVLLKKLEFTTDDNVCDLSNAGGYKAKTSLNSTPTSAIGLEVSLGFVFSLLMGCLIGATGMYFAMKQVGDYGSYQPVIDNDAEADNRENQLRSLELRDTRV